jgi:hypothetical protein
MTEVFIPFWIIAGAIGIPTAWLWWHDRRAGPGLCPKCRYDLAGLADGAACPECGCTETARER